MLEALLKYPPGLYAQGEIVPGWPWWLGAVVLAAAIGGAWWVGRRAHLGRGERLGLAVGRGLLLALLLALLADPELVVPMPGTTRGALLMLVDESRSQSIADDGATSRAERLAAALSPRDGAVTGDLAARFDLRWHAFGGGLRALAPGEWPAFEAGRSDLSGALAAIADGAARARPAGVVLLSDGGADQPGLDEALLALRARGVPVHVVATAAPRSAPDVGVVSLALPELVLAGDSVEADVVIGASGRAGSARLAVSVGGGQRVQRDIDLPAGDGRVRLRVPLETAAAGLHAVQVSVTAGEGDALPANDVAEALLEVRASAPPVLHFEGEPRFEVKFLRRALADDPALPLVSLVRTADNKYYRLGVTAEDELAEGFPRTASALFRYGVLVIGAEAAAVLDAGQLALVEDFVARRGGALVLLGGPRDGGRWPETIGRMSPLPSPSRSTPAAAVVRVGVPERVRDHPVVRFLAEPGAHLPLDELPPLTLVQPVERAKPGATTLLVGARPAGEPAVAMAWHRYGRGSVLALPVRDTWRWQLNADVPADDPTHELFWRQALRWLARAVTPRVALAVPGDAAVPGVAVPVRATVLDTDWQPLAGAAPRLRVVTPLGDVVDTQLRAVAGRPGEFEASFVPETAGAHELRLLAGEEDDAGVDADATRWLPVTEDGAEFRAVSGGESLLRRVAEVTGGSYRTLAEAASLPGAIDAAGSDVETLRHLPLRDVPLVYLLLVLLACGEWAWRRRRRLP